MPVRVGINGFGRIGRNVFRAAAAAKADIEWVGVNDLADVHTLANLLKYDSVLGRYPGTVEVHGDSLVVDGHPLRVLAERSPADLPWGDLGADIVIESTGFFNSPRPPSTSPRRQEGRHHAPASGDQNLRARRQLRRVRQGDRPCHQSSCTTSCLAPFIRSSTRRSASSTA